MHELFCFPVQGLEPVVHGRGRKTGSSDEMYLGVYEELLYARKVMPVEGNFVYHSFSIALVLVYCQGRLVVLVCRTSFEASKSSHFSLLGIPPTFPV